MADILKISTPLVNKSPVQPSKQAADPATAFDLQDISKVIKSNPKGEMLNQNNTMLQNNEAPSVLINLLKDPSVTVNFLKNIFMLQEIIKLLPVNNSTVTQEIHQLFDALLINPEEIVGEMVRQEKASTSFKGEFFDLLRTLVSNNPDPEMKTAVANLLKSMNGEMTKANVLASVANNLQFLAESLEPSKTLSEKLGDLSNAFRKESAVSNFQTLKGEVIEILKEVEDSILFSPKMGKILPIIVYNLSRFQDNQDFIGESISNLLMQMNGKALKANFLESVKGILTQITEDSFKGETSKVMSTLAEIIGKETEDADITLLNSEKIEKIIHSLLSSPCNFTPLLHFVIPVQYMDMKSFAEVWIDPNSDGMGTLTKDSVAENVHMLLVFDIEGIGQFEAEIYVKDKIIDLSLLCPSAYIDIFSKLNGSFYKLAKGFSYKFGSINIDKLEHARSLMDVFKSLPYKRTGVDVKV